MNTHDSLPTKIARTATAAISHSNAVEMVCLGGDSDDVKRMVRALNDVDREADELSRHPKLKAVIGHQPSKVETILLSLLVASQFDVTCYRECKSIRSLISVTATRRAEMAVEAISCFREGGSLHDLVWLDYGPSLSDSRAILKDSVLAELLGLEPGESDVRCDAVGEEMIGGRR